jgi:hypothetical protein
MNENLMLYTAYNYYMYIFNCYCINNYTVTVHVRYIKGFHPRVFYLPHTICVINVDSVLCDVADTKEERNALMQHVYPKLAEYCRNNYGLEFQVSIIIRTMRK